MAGIAQKLGAAGPPIRLIWGERVVTARPLSLWLKAAFERQLKERACSYIAPLAEMVSPAKWAEAVTAVTEKGLRGAYAFGGPLCLETIQTLDGLLGFAQLIFDLNEEDMLQLMQDKKAEVQSILAQVLAEAGFVARAAGDGVAVEGAGPN